MHRIARDSTRRCQLDQTLAFTFNAFDSILFLLLFLELRFLYAFYTYIFIIEWYLLLFKSIFLFSRYGVECPNPNSPLQLHHKIPYFQLTTFVLLFKATIVKNQQKLMPKSQFPSRDLLRWGICTLLSTASQSKVFNGQTFIFYVLKIWFHVANNANCRICIKQSSGALPPIPRIHAAQAGDTFLDSYYYYMWGTLYMHCMQTDFCNFQWPHLLLNSSIHTLCCSTFTLYCFPLHHKLKILRTHPMVSYFLTSNRIYMWGKL